MICEDLQDQFICNNNGGNYNGSDGEFDLGFVDTKLECKIKCQSETKSSSMGLSGCCSRKENGHCYWYPNSQVTCCWATKYSASTCQATPYLQYDKIRTYQAPG